MKTQVREIISKLFIYVPAFSKSAFSKQTNSENWFVSFASDGNTIFMIYVDVIPERRRTLKNKVGLYFQWNERKYNRDEQQKCRRMQWLEMKKKVNLMWKKFHCLYTGLVTDEEIMNRSYPIAMTFYLLRNRIILPW